MSDPREEVPRKKHQCPGHHWWQELGPSDLQTDPVGCEWAMAVLETLAALGIAGDVCLHWRPPFKSLRWPAQRDREAAPTVPTNNHITFLYLLYTLGCWVQDLGV